jgi:hypothetical protein
MKRFTRFLNVIFWNVAILSVVLSGNALAHKLKSPKTIKVTVKDNIITKVNVQGRRDNQLLNVDVTADLDCDRGYTIKGDPEFIVKGYSPVKGDYNLTGPWPSVVPNVVFKNAPIANVNQLRSVCGSRGNGVLAVPAELRVVCKDKPDFGSLAPPADDIQRTTYVTLPVYVQCKKTTTVRPVRPGFETKNIKTTTVPIRYRHTCPPGYFVKNTTQRVVEDGSSARKNCVQESDAGQKACPFIYTQEAPGGKWIEQGTILTYHNGKLTERTQVTELTAFSGKILIREIDPETSYTDSLKVILYYEDGSKEVLLPKTEELRETDGNYLITNQGDEVVVDFGIPSRGDFKRAELITDGYYELY